jgi:hypothetical protein
MALNDDHLPLDGVTNPCAMSDRFTGLCPRTSSDSDTGDGANRRRQTQDRF